MSTPPFRDVDSGEFILRPKTGIAHRSVGHRTAVAAAVIEKSDGGTRKVKVMHSVAVRDLEIGERSDQPVATSREIVQVNQIDREARADASQERLIALFRKTREVRSEERRVGKECRQGW